MEAKVQIPLSTDLISYLKCGRSTHNKTRQTGFKKLHLKFKI